ncbi:MAG: hypothetical protein J0I42_18730 [Bosea sp.]|uniref:methyltransferase family protein n=1 Tax=Bosea sp. (in: a-proteobacteria) TaxID=1871050 RepID=UPI001ACA0A70|nr:methyltransferase [Bosea sp. (in: a-proteobacteria)]MBN9453978.1 hypothetical protein [Bosea sp. (in: a-proteobacteria)]
MGLAVIGAAVALRAQVHMERSWCIGAAEAERGAIIDAGRFALSRNPVFVGQTLFFIGLFLVRLCVIELALVFAVLIAIALQVRIEEGVLRRDLGASYAACQRRVKRWIRRPC